MIKIYSGKIKLAELDRYGTREQGDLQRFLILHGYCESSIWLIYEISSVQNCNISEPEIS